jgi:Domain of unknown function (DUF4263)
MDSAFSRQILPPRYRRPLPIMPSSLDLKRESFKVTEMPLVKSFTSVLAKATTERAVCSWLKKNPSVISHGLGGFPGMVVAEFPFGSDFRADFVRLTGFSGGFDIHFVELEPPTAALFTKSGAAAKRLNGALAQINSWRSYIETDRQSVLRELSKFTQKRELIWKHRDREPEDHVGWRLYNPKSLLTWQYHIVIGRRKRLSEEHLFKKATFLRDYSVNVMTYDRLLETAKMLDDYERPKLP